MVPRAAGQGDAAAESNLGGMYEDGNGVPEDWVEAARWYGKSAARGPRGGQFSLGRAYQFGIGVPQNRKLAIEWFQKAAFLGNAQARFFAQHLLSRGNFVGFRDEQEEAYVIAGKLRTGLLWEEPVGMLFRSSGERLAYIRNLRYRVDRYEAYTAWVMRQERLRRLPAQQPVGLQRSGPAPQ